MAPRTAVTQRKIIKQGRSSRSVPRHCDLRRGPNGGTSRCTRLAGAPVRGQLWIPTSTLGYPSRNKWRRQAPPPSGERSNGGAIEGLHHDLPLPFIWGGGRNTHWPCNCHARASVQSSKPGSQTGGNQSLKKWRRRALARPGGSSGRVKIVGRLHGVLFPVGGCVALATGSPWESSNEGKIVDLPYEFSFPLEA